MWLRQVGVQRSVKEVTTMKKLLGCLSMAALAVVLASPLSAQNLTLKVSVPFDFSVGGHTLPAGDYLVSTVNVTGFMDSGYLAVRNVSSGATPTVITSIPAGKPLHANWPLIAQPVDLRSATCCHGSPAPAPRRG